jgi:hypothetical protein
MPIKGVLGGVERACAGTRPRPVTPAMKPRSFRFEIMWATIRRLIIDQHGSRPAAHASR